jgi:hypothetical protein
MRSRSLAWLYLVVFLGTLPSTYTFAAKKAAKGKKGGKAASRNAGNGGGFGGGGAAAALKLPASLDANLAAALRERCGELKKLKSARVWLETGALLVKAKEYGEAERVFRMGAHFFPKEEMLSAAALTFGGDSCAYDRRSSEAALSSLPGLDPLSDDSFNSFEAPADLMQTEDQADRAVDWKVGGGDLSRRGVVHQSKGPLIDPERCAWVIREVEAHCAKVGWSTARHVQAPTTDIPVSQVESIREWFEEMLREVLFPMLAARYPYAISSPDELRVMDAFVVRYDAREQASLPKHQDENVSALSALAQPPSVGAHAHVLSPACLYMMDRRRAFLGAPVCRPSPSPSLSTTRRSTRVEAQGLRGFGPPSRMLSSRSPSSSSTPMRAVW